MNVNTTSAVAPAGPSTSSASATPSAGRDLFSGLLGNQIQTMANKDSVGMKPAERAAPPAAAPRAASAPPALPPAVPAKAAPPASTASGMHQIPRKRRGRYRRCGSRNGRSKPENWCSAALRNTESYRGYGKDAENQRPG